MRKIYSLVLAALLLMSATFSFAQQTSFGRAPESNRLPVSISNDNVLNANNRGFVYISGTGSHQLNKQFMGNVTVTPIGSPITPGWIGATARHSNGTIYVCNQAAPFEIWTVDTTTGATTLVTSCTSVPHANLTGITWDHTTNTMYGCSSDITTSRIFTINLTTGVCTPLGTNSSVCAAAIGIYCAPNGTLFSHDIVGNNLYKWGKSDGVATLVGPLGFDANFGQDGSFDLSDGMLYLASAGPGNILRVCDTTTGSATTVIGTYAGQPSCLSIVGESGPAITHTPLPNTQNITGPYVANATIVPAGATTITSAKVYWSRNNPTVTDSVTMTNSGNNYSGSIPGNGTNATYRYYIKAIASDGKFAVSPGGAPANLYLFTANSVDPIPPVIVHTPIGPTPKTIWPVAVTATVTDNIGVDSAWVRWRINSGVTKQFKLINTTGSIYTALFNSVNADVNPNDIITYRIYAQDNSLQHNRDSSAQYNFTIINLTTACIGTGTIQMGSSSGPYNTFWWGNRTQFLWTAAEILANSGAAGSIQKIGFSIATVGGQPMNGMNIRMQHTSLTTLSGFTATGWTTAFTGNYTVPGTGWQYVDLLPFFQWNGTSNLMVEICFGNTSYTTATVVNGTTISGMENTEYHDVSTACSYAGFTTPVPQTARANVCFVIAPGLSINPGIGNIPTVYSLSQNYPNPFNPVTKINFALPKQGFVSLKIYDVLGREVRTLVNEVKSAGQFSVDFNASEFSSGVYFYRLEADGFTDIKRMMLIK